MKRILKWLVLTSVAVAIIGLLAYKWQRRGPGPLWEPAPERKQDGPVGVPPIDTSSAPVDIAAGLVEEPAAEPIPTVLPPDEEQPIAPEPVAENATPAVETPSAWMAPAEEPVVEPAPVIDEDDLNIPAFEEPAATDITVDDLRDWIERSDEEAASEALLRVGSPVDAAGLVEAVPPAEEPRPSPAAEAPVAEDEHPSEADFPRLETHAPEQPFAELPSVAEALAELDAHVEPSAAPWDQPATGAATSAFREPVREEDIALPDTIEEALADVQPKPVPAAPGRDAESYLDEGNVYFNVGQYGLAIERYTRALELDASLTAGYYNRANARTRAGEYDGALSDYNHALELQPDDADALNNRGMLYLYRANYDSALRDFDAALASDPSDTTVMVNRGLAHLHGGDAAAALVDFQEASALDDSDAAAHYGAGQAAAVLGNRDEALKRIRRALQIDGAYAREAAADAKLASLQGDAEFMRLLRESGGRR